MAPERGQKMPGQVKNKELYGLIKEALREVLREERFEYFLKSVPSVPPEEMEEIKRIHGSPRGKRRVSHSVTIKL